MIDPAAILVDALNNDSDVFMLLSGGVYAYRIPPDAVPPLALVMVPAGFPAAAPSPEWWTYMATIDIHAEFPALSQEIADKVSRLSFSIVGETSNGVVADCQVASVAAVTDGNWTPTRYRQVVTVDLTARRTFEGG